MFRMEFRVLESNMLHALCPTDRLTGAWGPGALIPEPYSLSSSIAAYISEAC